jgi:hypothetical protein
MMNKADLCFKKCSALEDMYDEESADKRHENWSITNICTVAIRFDTQTTCWNLPGKLFSKYIIQICPPEMRIHLLITQS